VTWILCLLLAAGLGISCLDTISRGIRLTEDRISYGKWFFWKGLEYTRITAVRFYYRIAQRGVKLPMLELSGDTGNKITIDLGLFDTPTNLGIIYDVLNKNARHADFSNSPEAFFTDPGANALKGHMVPEPYTLPLTLRVARSTFMFWSILCLPIIAAMVYFAAIGSPPPNMVTWALVFLMIGGFSLLYLYFILPAIRLTEDKISYREHFFSKEMEYTTITAIRYYYRDSRSVWDSGPVLELSGDNGDKITMRFVNSFISPKNLPIIYDVLKKNASRAGIHKSPEEFFAHPDITAGS
jgi:hypothetical protein